MYQPISFNVISQALDWHGLPVPTLRQLSYRDDDPHEITAEYLATWAMDRIFDYMDDIPLPPYHAMMAAFVDRVREAFCEDVEVADVHINPLKDDLIVLLYVRVSKAVHYWAENWTQ